MHSIFAVFDSDDGIARSPSWSKRIALVRCTPSDAGDKHFTISEIVLPTQEVSIETNPVARVDPQTIYVQWQSYPSRWSPYQKIQFWPTGVIVNGSVPVIDCDFKELFVPRECKYTVRGDTVEMCTARQRFQKDLRRDAIDSILSRSLPTRLIAPYVTRRPPTPMPSDSGYGDDDEDDDDDDDESLIFDAMSPSAPPMMLAPPPPPSQSAPSEIPIFVANLIKKEAIEKNEMCPISMESFLECKSFRLTSCYHLFEGDSLKRWLETKSTCPLCKQQVKSTLEFM